MRKPLIVVLVVGMVLACSQARAQAVFQPDATGADFMAATPRDQGLLLLTLMRRMHPAADDSTQVVEAAKLGLCLKESMTPRKRSEQAATHLLRGQKLTDLLALCAVLERSR